MTATAPDARLPGFYLPLAVLSLAAAAAAWFAPSREAISIAVLFGAVGVAILVASDGVEVWRGRGVVGRLILTGGTLYWFWLDAWTSNGTRPPFLSPQPLYPYFVYRVPDEVVATGILCLNLFLLASLTGWRFLGPPRRWIQRLSGRMDPPSRGATDGLILGLACLGWVPVYITHDGDLARALDSLLAMRAYRVFGPSVTWGDPGVLKHLHLVAVFAGALALARVFFNNPGSPALRILAVAAVLPLVFLGQSSRFNFAYFALPAVIMLTARGRSRIPWTRRRRLAAMLAFSVLALTLVQGAARNVGFETYLRATSASARPVRQDESLVEAGFYGHEQFGAMLMAIDLVPDHHPYFREPMLPYFFTHFVPRAWWPGKTYPRSWLYYNRTVNQGHGFNVTPSVIGQYYMNWGLLGVVFVGALFGWFARIGEYWFSRIDAEHQMLSATLCGVWLAFLFLSFRFLYPLYFTFVFFGFLVYWIVTALWGRRGGGRAGAAPGPAPST